MSRQSEETLEGDDLRTCGLQVRDEGHGLVGMSILLSAEWSPSGYLNAAISQMQER